MPESEKGRLLVWDLPVRLFHWGLAIAVVTNVVTANIGRMDLHERSGLTVLGLVTFKILWGFLGGHHARFVNFVRMPWTVLAWLRAPVERGAPEGRPFTAGGAVCAGATGGHRLHGRDRDVFDRRDIV